MNTSTLAGWRAAWDTKPLWGNTLAGLAGGAAGGLAAGVAARIAMRGVAIVGGQTPSFTLEGTFFIIMFGALLGTWPGLALGFIQALWPGRIRRRGVLLGAAIGLIFGALLLTIPATGELALVPQPQAAAMFAGIPVIYGIVLGLVAERLAPQGPTAAESSAGFARAAGWLTAAAALVGTAAASILALTHPAIMRLGLDTTKALEQALGAATLAMMVMGLAGLAAGGGTGGRLALGGTLAVMLGGALFSVAGGGLGGMNMHAFARAIARPGLTPTSPATASAVVLLTLGLLAVGLAATASRRWTGWRAYLPLLPGLLLVLSAGLLYPKGVPAALRMTGSEQAQLGLGLAAAFALGWLALGVMLAREGRGERSSAPAVGG